MTRTYARFNAEKDRIAATAHLAKLQAAYFQNVPVSEFWLGLDNRGISFRRNYNTASLPEGGRG